MDAVDHDQRIADVVGLHDVALVDQEIAGAPVDGRADLRVRELQPHVLHRRLVRPHHGARGLHRRLVGLDRGGQAQLVRADLVVLLARDHAAVDQPPVAILLDHGIVVLRLVAREVGLGLGDLRLMLGELGARLLERGLEGARVDGEEEVAGLDVLALLEVDPGDLAADLGEHGHRRRRLHVADGPHPHGDVARGHLRHGDGHAGDTPFGLGPGGLRSSSTPRAPPSRGGARPSGPGGFFRVDSSVPQGAGRKVRANR